MINNTLVSDKGCTRPKREAPYGELHLMHRSYSHTLHIQVFKRGYHVYIGFLLLVLVLLYSDSINEDICLLARLKNRRGTLGFSNTYI